VFTMVRQPRCSPVAGNAGGNTFEHKSTDEEAAISFLGVISVRDHQAVGDSHGRQIDDSTARTSVPPW